MTIKSVQNVEESEIKNEDLKKEDITENEIILMSKKLADDVITEYIQKNKIIIEDEQPEKEEAGEAKAIIEDQGKNENNLQENLDLKKEI